jgi:hypothetical protein
MNEEHRDLVRQWCNACEREYAEKCWECPLWGLVYGIGKHYTQGWTMAQAFRAYMRMSPSPERARQIMEDTIGMPLNVARMILREIRDYEDCHDV